MLLAEILNGEPARIRIELEKLATYVQGRGRITTADVEALVVAARRNTVWQLTDMLASRKRKDALAFLDNLLREGEQPAGIVGALAWTYRKLIEARASAAADPRFSGRAPAWHAPRRRRERLFVRPIASRRRNFSRPSPHWLKQTASLNPRTRIPAR